MGRWKEVCWKLETRKIAWNRGLSDEGWREKVCRVE